MIELPNTLTIRSSLYYKRMANRGLKDAQEARYLRKLQKDAGYDEEEEEQDKVFKEDV